MTLNELHYKIVQNKLRCIYIFRLDFILQFCCALRAQQFCAAPQAQLRDDNAKEMYVYVLLAVLDCQSITICVYV